MNIKPKKKTKAALLIQHRKFLLKIQRDYTKTMNFIIIFYFEILGRICIKVHYNFLE